MVKIFHNITLFSELRLGEYKWLLYNFKNYNKKKLTHWPQMFWFEQ